MIRRLLTGLVFMFFVGTASAQYRVDRLITAGRSALYYEDYVLSIKYFNLAIGAKPYLYEPWYYRSVAKFNLDDFVGAEGDANEALKLNPYINDITTCVRLPASDRDVTTRPFPTMMQLSV